MEIRHIEINTRANLLKNVVKNIAFLRCVFYITSGDLPVYDL